MGFFVVELFFELFMFCGRIRKLFFELIECFRQFGFTVTSLL